jgi:hypothetical protein
VSSRPQSYVQHEIEILDGYEILEMNLGLRDGHRPPYDLLIVTWDEADRHHQFMPPSPENLPFPRPADTYEFPDPTTQAEKTAFRTKGASKYYDPCGPASKASMRCLDRNNYDRSKCQAAFDAYKECKRIWVGSPHYQADI